MLFSPCAAAEAGWSGLGQYRSLAQSKEQQEMLGALWTLFVLQTATCMCPLQQQKRRNMKLLPYPSF